MKEEIKGVKTPNGGVRVEVIYLDAEGSPIDKEKAVRYRMLEYDEKDKLIHSVYGSIGG